MTQEKALEFLKSGQHVFLTGSAGTGKTYVLKQFITYCRKHKIEVSITASTGIAASHLGGQTLHSWCGMGIKSSMSKADINQLKEKKYLTKKIEKSKVLIIDEVSMLHKTQLELADQITRVIRKDNSVFGGLQLVFCGDFFQLPPVSDTTEDSRQKFAFMSSTWVESKPIVCYLDKIYRQTDTSLITTLNQIRKGQNLPQVYSHLINKAKAPVEAQKNAPILYTHNVDVDAINKHEFSKLKGKIQRYAAKFKGKEVLGKMIVDNSALSHELALKPKTKVIFLKNNFEAGYVNGTLGEVVDFWQNDEGKKLPVVETKDGETIFVKYESWPLLDEKGNEIAVVEQIPLRYAWAITVHKSQGMSLDEAIIDLSKTFEVGQGYVALSRVSSMSGIHLLGINELALNVDKLAQLADVRFEELSRTAEVEYSASQLETLRKNFIIESEGVLMPISNSKKKGSKKQTKISTYEITHNLLEEKLSVEQIAKRRQLTVETVLRHCLTIKKEAPDYDFTTVKANKEHVAAVAEVLKKLKSDKNSDLYSENGHIKLKPIFSALNGKLEFKEISRALLFCEY